MKSSTHGVLLVKPAPRNVNLGSDRFACSTKSGTSPDSGTRACLQLGELCARTDQNQTRNTVLLRNAARSRDSQISF